MFYLILILGILFFFLLLSVYVHEYGHALFAKLFGWQVHGMTVDWKKGAIGMKVEINQNNPEDIWKIAAGGLIASLALFAISIWFSLLLPVFSMLAIINFFIVAVNIIPLKGSDGYYIFRQAIRHFRRPNG